MTQKLKDDDMVEETIALQIVSDVKYLELVQLMANWLTARRAFSEEEVFHITIAIGEAVSNAIIHGNKNDIQKIVNIELTLLPDGLKAIIQDQGKGFDINAIPNPLDSCNMLKSCGRGIYYMKSFMDEVNFNLLPEGKGMEVSLVKRIKGKKSKSLTLAKRQDEVK